MNAPTPRIILIESDDEALAYDAEQLRAALDHILRAARSSHSQTRRVRWIAQRAEWALAGKPYDPRQFERPKISDVAGQLHQRLKRTRQVLAALVRSVSTGIGSAEALKDARDELQEAV